MVTPTGYTPLTTGELVGCDTCGAAVSFTMMTTHTRWHEGRWQEPMNDPSPEAVQGHSTDAHTENGP